VFDLTRDVVEDIAKTESLDDMFRQNYESDPALSWQYFGSVTGMLRQYPAMQWRTNSEDIDDDNDDNKVDNKDVYNDSKNDSKNIDDDDDYDDESPADLYDCRVRSWFIEAATCSKDMVILMDVSGSMTGMGKTIGMRDQFH